MELVLETFLLQMRKYLFAIILLPFSLWSQSIETDTICYSLAKLTIDGNLNFVYYSEFICAGGTDTINGQAVIPVFDMDTAMNVATASIPFDYLYIDSNRHVYKNSNGQFLYAFDALAGDTITIPTNGGGSYDVFITGSDTIVLSNGVVKEIYSGYVHSLLSSGNSFLWINGIGSFGGPLNLNTYEALEIISEVACIKTKDEILYNDSSHSGCVYLVNISSDEIENFLRIAPNPASNRIKIATLSKVRSITILNSQGQIEMRIEEPISEYVSLENIGSGMKVLMVETFSGRVLREKLLVNK